jgi:beta-xylosidase
MIISERMKPAGRITKTIILLILPFLTCCNRPDRVVESKYTNPILHADYSDPDVIRAGDDYYMVTSSFNCVPGLPVLHSRDLVSWDLVGYALGRLTPEEHYSSVQHGGGVWAPCIRIHKGLFYIYYPDPDYGIFMVRASDPSGPWSSPVQVMEGKGLIDPSPLWDSDGSAYLVYAFAGSRAGVKSVLMITRLNSEGTAACGDPVMVFDGHDDDPTVEGPKLYTRNGWYYIFAPAGGVTNGWQLVLRSKDIFGPYEKRIVLHQGESPVNGPHQGAWVTTRRGQDWFIHFQDKGAYGRIVHLEPVKWTDDWPVIGIDNNGDGIGEPVASFTKPDAGRVRSSGSLRAGDEFNSATPGLQWQWPANPSATWGFPSEAYGFYRLNCIARPDSIANLWTIPNLLLQKLPAEEFVATASVKCTLRYDGEEAGMIIMGKDYQYISLRRMEGKTWLRVARCTGADRGSQEEEIYRQPLESGKIFLRIKTEAGGLCTFNYSTDNTVFKEAGKSFIAREGMWIGAKFGFFALRDGFINDAGYTDIDWVRILTTD